MIPVETQIALLRELVELQDKLLTHYRLGSRPPGGLLDDIRATKNALGIQS